jgi:hypothetical protein
VILERLRPRKKGRGGFCTTEVVGYHGQGQFDVDENYSECKDGEGEEGGHAGEEGDGDCGDDEEGEDEAVDWIEEHHFLFDVSSVMSVEQIRSE